MQRVIAGSPGQPPQVIALSDAEVSARQAEEIAWLNTDHRTPLEIVTDAVKSLPVAKRTDPTWGVFISQCLLALQNSDIEALAYLVNGFVTEDTDYLQIIGAAKALFNI